MFIDAVKNCNVFKVKTINTKIFCAEDKLEEKLFISIKDNGGLAYKQINTHTHTHTHTHTYIYIYIYIEIYIYIQNSCTYTQGRYFKYLGIYSFEKHKQMFGSVYLREIPILLSFMFLQIPYIILDKTILLLHFCNMGIQLMATGHL